MTYNEFAKKYLGKGVDFDGVYNVQCVDLADRYFADVIGIKTAEMPWVSGARELYNNFSTKPALVKNFDRIPNTKELVCKKGDVVIWGGGKNGHVAIATGEGSVDWFVSIEQNTLGRNEPCQKVKHWFNNKSGYDSAWPVLGVLRPKDQTKVNGLPPVLDSGSCYKPGDKTVGALAVKELLRLAAAKKLHSVTVTETKSYDDSAVKAVKALQKAWGYKETGCAGEKFVKLLAAKLK